MLQKDIVVIDGMGFTVAYERNPETGTNTYRAIVPMEADFLKWMGKQYTSIHVDDGTVLVVPMMVFIDAMVKDKPLPMAVAPTLKLVKE